MGCETQVDSSYSLICAKICDKPNEKPVASFRFDNFFLVDTSTFYDDGNVSSRRINWKVYVGVGQYLIYDFGWGYYNDLIPDLANGSTYSILDVGVNNSDIIGLLESLPSTFITKNVTFKLVMYVEDNTGVQSEASENTYTFNKII